MALLSYWAGWSTTKRSNRMCRCGTGRNAQMTRYPAVTFGGTKALGEALRCNHNEPQHWSTNPKEVFRQRLHGVAQFIFVFHQGVPNAASESPNSSAGDRLGVRRLWLLYWNPCRKHWLCELVWCFCRGLVR